MFSLHRRAKDYHQRPSELLLIEQPLMASAFDRWVHVYGTKVDALLEERKKEKQGKNTVYKPKYTLEQALGKACGAEEQRFSGFKAMFMKLRQSGQKKVIYTR